MTVKSVKKIQNPVDGILANVGDTWTVTKEYHCVDSDWFDLANNANGIMLNVRGDSFEEYFAEI